LPVQDRDAAPGVTDQAGALQNALGDRYRGAPDSQHLGKEFLGQPEGVTVDAVVGHEQRLARPSMLCARLQATLCASSTMVTWSGEWSDLTAQPSDRSTLAVCEFGT
jgi:hypothetical protein